MLLLSINLLFELQNIIQMSESSIKKPYSSKGAQNIKVFVRVRPFNNKQDPQKNCISFVNQKNISIKQKDAKQPHNFTFDKVFDIQTSQYQVYNAVGSQIVQSAFNGLNGTIFCYGQTSSGKTHTCVGPDFRDQISSGIVPRLIKQTIYKIQNRPKNIDAKMKISMVEIYNQKIKDLLDPSKVDLKIRSNKKQGIFLQSLTQKYILSLEEAFNFLNTGIHNRSVSATNMNSESSRSHMVFIINLTTHDIYSGQAKNAKIILVDLAGSQKISKTGAEGKVLEEAKKINTSLTALGKVINALSDNKGGHVPYRDSKLTRLLQQSLGGNSLTNLIVNVSPSSFNEYETLTSIRFGQRAKSIKNQPVVNKTYTVQQLLQLLKKAEQTIHRQNLLIKQLSNKKRTGGYGAINIPPITMHLLSQQDQLLTNRSIQCQSQGPENTQQIDDSQKFEAYSKMSQQTIQLKLPANRKRIKNSEQKNVPDVFNTKKFKTFTNFSNQFQSQDVLDKFQGSNPLQDQSFNNKANQFYQRSPFKQVQTNINKRTNIKESSKLKVKIPSIIHEDSMQYAVTPKNIEHKQADIKQEDIDNEFLKSQDNINKIKQNLFELKLRYLQQKQENNIKSLIIERKNRVIAKAKSFSFNQTAR